MLKGSVSSQPFFFVFFHLANRFCVGHRKSERVARPRSKFSLDSRFNEIKVNFISFFLNLLCKIMY